MLSKIEEEVRVSENIIPFWLAMKLVSEGKEVQYQLESTAAWIKFDGIKPAKNYMDNHIKWRLKPTPVKYSVDIWLDKQPVSYSSYRFKEILLGDADWSNERTNDCNKKHKITVESVE